jgi:ADP-ribosyl-[dinitrogen reductase] hydrolase
MLLESAVADSYGAGFEYAPSEIVRAYGDLLTYRAHPKHVLLTPGRYTDDTQMGLAVAEAMLDPDEPWTAESFAERFVRVFKRDERTGYSKRMYSLLTSVNSGSELLEAITVHSNRSGAAMRGWMIGLYGSVAEVLNKSKIQAEVTHNTPLGIAAAQAAALMTLYFAHDVGTKKSLGRYVDNYLPNTFETSSWSEPFVGKVGSEGWQSVKAAITAVTRNNTLSEILRDCIRFTGDVDTVAAIAIGAASLSREVEHDLPQNLFDGLENGPYGRDYIADLDHKLLGFLGL